MAVKGVFASDASIQGERKGDFASALLQVMPTGSAQLLALSSGMKESPATDTLITWFEENHISGRVTASGAVNSSATSVNVNDASAWVAGVIAMVEATGEYILVTAVTGNALTIVRGFAGSTADAIGSGGGLQRIGTATEEASSKPTAVANQGYPRFNYTQIFRNTWNVSGTAKAVQFYTGSKVAKNRADCGAFHAEDIERSLIWGRKSTGHQNGEPFRTMDGINTMITTNVESAGGTTDYDDIDAFMMDVFANNIKGQPNERIAFCGNQALAVLNGIARIEGTIDIRVGQTDFGLTVNTWRSPYGTINFMTHPLMNENAIWTKDIYVYHPGAITLRWLRRTMRDDYDKDGSRAGDDADYGVITSELSIQYDAEITGGKFTGLTKAAAVS